MVMCQDRLSDIDLSGKKVPMVIDIDTVHSD
jgi:hypothetical protein